MDVSNTPAWTGIDTATWPRTPNPPPRSAVLEVKTALERSTANEAPVDAKVGVPSRVSASVASPPPVWRA